MALERIKDLDLRFSSADVYEWQYEGVRFRYDRRKSAVSRESATDVFDEWHRLDKNDLGSAKRKVFQLINQEWF